VGERQGRQCRTDERVVVLQRLLDRVVETRADGIGHRILEGVVALTHLDGLNERIGEEVGVIIQ
jgi:hypothetical protein